MDGFLEKRGKELREAGQAREASVPQSGQGSCPRFIVVCLLAIRIGYISYQETLKCMCQQHKDVGLRRWVPELVLGPGLLLGGSARPEESRKVPEAADTPTSDFAHA